MKMKTTSIKNSYPLKTLAAIDKEEILIITKHDAFRDLLLIKETRSDGEIWFKVPNSVSSPNIELVIEDIRNQVVKIENSCDEDEKAVLNHFKNFIKEIAEYQLKNGAEITKDNISLYYGFMDDDDLEKNAELINTKFTIGRFKRIVDGVFISEDRKKQTIFISSDGIMDGNSFLQLKQSVFNVKDTLKPIDEYIEEIKESDAYKSYIAKA